MMFHLTPPVIKVFSVSRRTLLEQRFHPKMGRLTTRVTRIYRQFMGVPYQTLHKYRETYHGEVKDCEECQASHVQARR